jgi:hypothetical protein
MVEMVEMATPQQPDEISEHFFPIYDFHNAVAQLAAAYLMPELRILL